MCSRELPGPIERASIYPQGCVPFHEIVYEVGETAVMKNNNAGLWVVGIETTEFWIVNKVNNVGGHIPPRQI